MKKLGPLLCLALLCVLHCQAEVLLQPAQDDEVEKLSEEESSQFVPPPGETVVKFEASDAIHNPEAQATSVEPEDEETRMATDIYTKALDLLKSSSMHKKTAWDMINQAASLEHREAKIKMAWAQMAGTFFDQDLQAANDIFEEMGNLGDPEAQMGVGFLKATGTLTNSSQAHGLLYYTFGAFGGSIWAQMALAYRYWSGMGVATSCEKALDYYRRVAQDVTKEVSFLGGQTLHRIRLLEELESSGYSSGVLDNDLLEYYLLLAEKGDTSAQVGLGQLYLQGGRGIEIDHRMAFHFFSQAADAGSGVALAFLGKMYLQGGDAVKQNNDTAYIYLKKAAELGNPAGHDGLGMMYLHGRGVPKDYKQAFDHFRKAADQNWADGLLHLGTMYFNGLGVMRDYNMAIKFFNLASQHGNIMALYYLADLHATGAGMLRSCPTAVELYKNVAERGPWGEMFMEAYSDYKQGNNDEAFIKYLILAELGYEAAQSNVAFMLDRQETSLYPEDDLKTRALVYWTRAAAQGYAAARVKLGDYYFYGLGTKKDYEAAAYHYRIASDQQNNAQAMFNLGYMHELGYGMRQDFHLAKRFYDLAAETSVDAKVPVALALTKLSFVFFWESWKDFKVILSPNTMASLELYWDLYLLTILLGLLVLVVTWRRPRLDREQQQQRIPEDQQPQQNRAP